MSTTEKPQVVHDVEIDPEVAALLQEFTGAKYNKLMRKLDLHLVPIVRCTVTRNLREKKEKKRKKRKELSMLTLCPRLPCSIFSHTSTGKQGRHAAAPGLPHIVTGSTNHHD